MMVYVNPLHTIACKDLFSAGGKGANLGEMINAGLPVPDGFVVLTSAYRDFVKKNNLQKRIDRVVKGIRADDVTALENAFKTINDLFDKCPIPKEITSEIVTLYNHLKGPVVVRSSAAAEDLPGTSFAGQYSTYLNVQGADEVLKAVRCCWASLWNARAVSYRLKQKIPLDVPFAVIVQHFIDGEKSGIVFTANPVNGRRDQVMINASWGLGESIVGGTVSPDQWVVDKAGIVETTISQKEVMTVSKKGGVKTVVTPEDLQKKPVLTKKDIGILTELAQKTENHFENPQDIEWVYKDRFYLVQTRPITSLFPLPQPEPEQGLHIYVSMNIVDQGVKEPLTPMGLEGFRLLYYGLSVMLWGSRASKYPDLVKIAAGQFYFDITDFLGIMKTFSKGFAATDPVTGEVLNHFLEENKEVIVKKGWLTLLSKIPLRPLLLVPSFMWSILHTAVHYEEAGKKVIAAAEKEISRLEKAADALQGIDDRLLFIEKECVPIIKLIIYGCAPLAVGLGALKMAEDLIKAWLNDIDIEPVRRSLPYNPTTEMSIALLEISQQFKEQNSEPLPDHPLVKDFLKKFGHRAVLEIDIGVPRWEEDPSYVLDILTLYMKGDPLQKIEKFYNGAHTAEQTINDIVLKVREKKSVVHAWIIKELLCCYRELGGLRERPKFDFVRSLRIFRSVLKDVGKELVLQGRLDTAEDIFFVTVADIESGGDLKSVAAHNKREYMRNVNRVYVPRVMTSTGEVLYRGEESKGALTGVPVSPGVYEGVVRIIHHPKGAHIEQGEILVTRSTDPGWTPLFIHAGALIMEMGGSVSHGSIVAREYGIPAVVNVAGATTRLENGQRIRVNGSSGEIVVLD
jgi:phosphohistidine swiveling domain-containing protein